MRFSSVVQLVRLVLPSITNKLIIKGGFVHKIRVLNFRCFCLINER